MSENKSAELDLAQELRELVRQLGEAVRVAREHPQTKEFEHQVSRAVGDLTTEVDRAIKTAQSEEHVQKVGAQVKQAAASLKESDAGQDIQRGLAKGMRALNEQIRRAIEQAEKPVGEGASSAETTPGTPAGEDRGPVGPTAD